MIKRRRGWSTRTGALASVARGNNYSLVSFRGKWAKLSYAICPMASGKTLSRRRMLCSHWKGRREGGLVRNWNRRERGEGAIPSGRFYQMYRGAVCPFHRPAEKVTARRTIWKKSRRVVLRDLCCLLGDAGRTNWGRLG